jgi:hypothetical protein
MILLNLFSCDICMEYVSLDVRQPAINQSINWGVIYVACSRVTGRVPLLEQELFTLPEHMIFLVGFAFVNLFSSVCGVLSNIVFLCVCFYFWLF